MLANTFFNASIPIATCNTGYVVKLSCLSGLAKTCVIRLRNGRGRPDNHAAMQFLFRIGRKQSGRYAIVFLHGDFELLHDNPILSCVGAPLGATDLAGFVAPKGAPTCNQQLINRQPGLVQRKRHIADTGQCT